MVNEMGHSDDRQDFIDRMDAEAAVTSHFQHVITSDRGKLSIYSWLDRLAKSLVTEANVKQVKRHFSENEVHQRMLSDYSRLMKIDYRKDPETRKNESFSSFISELEKAGITFTDSDRTEIKTAIGLCVDQLAQPGSKNRELMQFDATMRR